MATSTFDKNIVIDDKAADVLIELLKKPAPPIEDVSHLFRELTEEDIELWLQRHSAHLSEQNLGAKPSQL